MIPAPFPGIILAILTLNEEAHCLLTEDLITKRLQYPELKSLNYCDCVGCWRGWLRVAAVEQLLRRRPDPRRGTRHLADDCFSVTPD
jgi:hypothetical protein